MDASSNDNNNEGRTTHNHDAFLQSLRNPQVGHESQLALLRIFIAGLPRAPMDEPPANESDWKCAVCRESLWSSSETEPLEVALKLECCNEFIGEQCLKIWLSPHSEGGGGGHTCPFCREQFIDRWPLVEYNPLVPREWRAAGDPTLESVALWREAQRLADEQGQPLFYDELLDAPRGRNNFDNLYQPFDDRQPPVRVQHGNNDSSLRNLFRSLIHLLPTREARNQARTQISRNDYSSRNLQVLRDRLLEGRARNGNHRNDELFLEPGSRGAFSIEHLESALAGTSLIDIHRDGEGELPNDREPPL